MGGCLHPSFYVYIFTEVNLINKDLRINERIRARQVRLISASGEQLGIVSLQEALAKARESDLDLVEVAPQADPPVCRIMDYGKYKYEQQKRDREARKRQKVVTVKEIKLRPGIDRHDLDVKVRNAQRFLKDGDKVKCTIMFRGREIIHKELGQKVLEQLAEKVGDLGSIERPPTMEGRNMIMILAPTGRNGSDN